MIKKAIMLMMCLFSFASFATTLGSCPPATETNTQGFCHSFKVAAQCHCTSSGIPRGMCMNMKSLYDRMVSIFGSVRRACEYQRDTNTQNCIDSWTCYRSGGYTSQNTLCNGNGNACE